MQQKGLRPSTARPAANVTACCSAIPTSYVRLGNLLPKISMPVPPGIAAVMPMMSRSVSAILQSSLANTEVKEEGFGGAPAGAGAPLNCLPVATSNLATPCILSEAVIAGW